VALEHPTEIDAIACRIDERVACRVFAARPRAPMRRLPPPAGSSAVIGITWPIPEDLDDMGLERKADRAGRLQPATIDAVVLSTIHSAKGLEWEAVFLVGMEQGVMPHINNDDLVEERRVAYVGITRAKRLIIGLTFANIRFGQTSRPSQFLYELAGKERRQAGLGRFSFPSETKG
jgi:UvrD-like helicase C-terminal domain